MKIEVKIPETLNDIKLNTWQSFTDIDMELKDDAHTMQMLKIIYDINYRDYKKLKSKDVTYLLGAVTKCLNEEPKLTQRFKLDGVEYGLIPNFDNITAGELFDIDAYSTKEKYHLLMSILYRPIIKEQAYNRYSIEVYDGSRDMGEMPLGIALGVLAFFLTLGEELASDTLNYLTPEEQAAAEKYLLAKSGDGKVPSIHSAMEILQR